MLCFENVLNLFSGQDGRLYGVDIQRYADVRHIVLSLIQNRKNVQEVVTCNTTD